MESFSDMLLRYGVIFGKRYTKKQKINFLRGATTEFEGMGLNVDVTHSEVEVFKGAKQNFYNLYAGKPKKADIIIASYYDTPTNSFGSYTYKAFSQDIPKQSMLINLLLPLLVLAIAGLLLFFVTFPKISLFGFYNVWGVLALAVLLLSLFIITRIRGGLENRHNMVRNTSSLISIISFAATLSPTERKRVAFAFLDAGCSSGYGHKMLEAYVGGFKGKKLIFLDSVGNPGKPQLFSNDACVSVIKEVDIHPLGEDIKNLGDYLITSGELENENIAIKNANSSKDTELKEEDIDKTVTLLKALSGALIKDNKSLKQA